MFLFTIDLSQGCKTCWMHNYRSCGLNSHIQVKSWMADVGLKPFSPQGKDCDCELPPDYVSLHQGWGLWWNCVLVSPSCFSVGFFLFIWCIGVTQIIIFLILRGNCLIHSCKFGVSVGGAEFGILLHHHLELEPKMTL